MHLDDDYLRAIGRLTVAAGQIEFDTFVLARLMMGGDFKVARAIAQGMQFAQLANIARKLATAQEPGVNGAMEWLNAASSFMGERNAILHATWVSDWPAPAGEHVNAMHIKTMRGVHISLESIHTAADQGDDLHRRFPAVSYKAKP